MTAGMAKQTMKLVTSRAQTNSGILFRDMPGARCLKMVLMVLTAMASDDNSVKVIICAQKSPRLPAEYSGPASGRYRNQPVSGPMLSANATYNIAPPNRYTQKAN